jgi:hypothetical protein
MVWGVLDVGQTQFPNASLLLQPAVLGKSGTQGPLSVLETLLPLPDTCILCCCGFFSVSHVES